MRTAFAALIVLTALVNTFTRPALAAATMANVSLVNPRPIYAPGAETRQAKLIGKIGPRSRDWIVQEGRKIANLSANQQAVAIADIKGVGGVASTDIDALCFLVMMEAAKDASDDLRALTNQIDETNKQKQALRAQMDALKAQQGKLKGQIANAQSKPPSSEQIDQKIAQLNDQKDSLDDLSQQDQLKLQQEMDKKSQLEEMISNLMKAQSDTQDTLARSLKD